jgi:hypothetical protein
MWFLPSIDRFLAAMHLRILMLMQAEKRLKPLAALTPIGKLLQGLHRS